ncbi:PilZ domain-containing protein [bacterium]|nr:PilZ domain-containing protein [bacterium]MCK4436708.1 PilZ domain-containing protein [bacterium]
MACEEWNGRERRKYRHLPTRVTVDYALRFAGDEKSIITEGRGVAKNISGDGMFLEISALSPQDLYKLKMRDDKLQITFTLPLSEDPIITLCELVWSKMVKPDINAIGIKFVSIKAVERAKILKYTINKLINDSLYEKS